MMHCMVMVSMNLTRPVSHLQCTKIIWQSKHQKEKDTLLQRFLTHGLKKQNVANKSVTSTDGTLTILQTYKCARDKENVSGMQKHFPPKSQS